MINTERKKIGNKSFYYLTEQIRVGTRYRKVQVYIGKHIPKNISPFYAVLCKKEQELIRAHLGEMYARDDLTMSEYRAIEDARIEYKYFVAQLSHVEFARFWRQFAIRFIFESNAIEGSKLSQDEVSAIIRHVPLKKSLDRTEVREARNAIKALESLMRGFVLNERSIIALHDTVIGGLGAVHGFKKRRIVVNNTNTTMPGEVRRELATLFRSWKRDKKTRAHPLLAAAKFHQRFERIHPFEDGNGRVGRLLFVWMLTELGYGPILFRARNRQIYFAALADADEGRNTKLYHHVADVYVRTIRELIQ